MPGRIRDRARRVLKIRSHSRSSLLIIYSDGAGNPSATEEESGQPGSDYLMPYDSTAGAQRDHSSIRARQERSSTPRLLSGATFADLDLPDGSSYPANFLELDELGPDDYPEILEQRMEAGIPSGVNVNGISVPATSSHVAILAMPNEPKRRVMWRLMRISDVDGGPPQATHERVDALLHVDPLAAAPVRPSRSQVPTHAYLVDPALCRQLRARELQATVGSMDGRSDIEPDSCSSLRPTPSLVAMFNWLDDPIQRRHKVLPAVPVQRLDKDLPPLPADDDSESVVARAPQSVMELPAAQISTDSRLIQLEEIMEYVNSPDEEGEQLPNQYIQAGGMQGEVVQVARLRARAGASQHARSGDRLGKWAVHQWNFLKVPSDTDKKWMCGGFIGKGGFGKVYLVYHIPQRQQLAIKVVQYSQGLSPAACRGAVNEIKLLRTVASAPNGPPSFLLTPYLQHDRWYWRASGGFLNIATNFCMGGELTQHQRSITESSLRLVAAELVIGIEALHNFGWTHGDLKPSNVLIDEYGHIVISDFGACRETTAISEERRSDVIYTACYAAPELLQSIRNSGCSYDSSIDYWSLGVMIATLRLGDNYIQGFLSTMLQNIADIQSRLENLPLKVPGLSEFITDLLKMDPALRLKEPQIKKHPYFDDLHGRWNSIRRRQIPPFSHVRQVAAMGHGFDMHFERTTDNLQERYRLLDVLREAGLDPELDESFDVRLLHQMATHPV
ncbi:kinase-like domain-containing protein [Sparassis latifolia]